MLELGAYPNPEESVTGERHGQAWSGQEGLFEVQARHHDLDPIQ